MQSGVAAWSCCCPEARCEDRGSVLVSVSELTVCLDTRTCQYSLNWSQAVRHRLLVSLGPVNNVLNPSVTGGSNPCAAKLQRSCCVYFLSLSSVRAFRCFVIPVFLLLLRLSVYCLPFFPRSCYLHLSLLFI